MAHPVAGWLGHWTNALICRRRVADGRRCLQANEGCLTPGAGSWTLNGIWFLLGALAFLIGIGVLGNRQRRGGGDGRDRYNRAAAQGHAEAHMRNIGSNVSGPGFP